MPALLCVFVLSVSRVGMCWEVEWKDVTNISISWCFSCFPSATVRRCVVARQEKGAHTKRNKNSQVAHVPRLPCFVFPPCCPFAALFLRAPDVCVRLSRIVSQIAHTLLVIQTMVDMYANETAVMGLQPVNEPWQFTPIDWLKVKIILN